ncbi:MAG: phytoene/squalene synthase family protein [Pseudomonadales bacterium]
MTLETCGVSNFSDADLQQCQRALQHGSRSFYLAASLLPAHMARPMTALYAFCRSADDVVDEAGDSAAAIALVQARIDAMVARTPLDFPEDRALAAVIAQHALPREPLDALLEGFAWDVTGRCYETLAELEGYGARVAGSVGVMSALLMGEQRSGPLARALDLGVAMQLTNICRDVGEDAALGRLYLPRKLLRSAGIEPTQFLAAPVHSAALGGVIQTVLARADVLYARGQQGVRMLPVSVRYSMRAAGLLYQQIGRQLARQDFNAIDQRAVVPRSQQLRLLARSLSPWPGDSSRLQLPPLASCEFLHEAALGSIRRSVPDGRVERMMALFMRLGERSGNGPSGATRHSERQQQLYPG